MIASGDITGCLKRAALLHPSAALAEGLILFNVVRRQLVRRTRPG